MTSIARSILSAQALADKFNRQFPVGTRVRYWTGAREGMGKVSVTRSEAQVLGGHTAVVWVDGYRDGDPPACIALSHIQPLPEVAA